MKVGQPIVSAQKSVAVGLRAGGFMLAVWVVLATPDRAGAAFVPNGLFVNDVVPVGEFHAAWIDPAFAAVTEPEIRLADAGSGAPVGPGPEPSQETAKPARKEEPVETAKPHNDDKRIEGLGLADRIQDWLARANREFQTTVIPRLSTPTQGSYAADNDTIPEKPDDVKAQNQQAADEDAVRLMDEARQAEEAAQAAKAEHAAQAAKAEKEAEEARKAEEEKAAEEMRAQEARKLAEESARAEEARKAAEEAQRIEDERKAVEEARKAEAERLAAEEAKRAEEARKVAEEDAARQAEAKRKAAEEAKRLEDERRIAEEAKRAEEARKAAEEAEAERRRAAELEQHSKQQQAVAARAAIPQRTDSIVAKPKNPRSQPLQVLKRKPIRPNRAKTKIAARKRVHAPVVRRWVRRVPRCANAGQRIALPGHYTVKSGDTLWRISKRYYRVGWQYWRIYRANKSVIRNPDLIYPCQRIFLPAPR